ncbi:MAG: cytochrome P450 [Anaerolineaceae bacterium]|nr:cytochrome P450 [Anaerolineaceae bacterium]
MAAQTLPPGPQAPRNFFQLLQLMRKFETDMLGYVSRSFKQYGGIWKIEAGGEIQYMISEPDLIQEITVKQADKFHKSPDYIDDKRGLARFLGTGLLTNDGEFWKRQRKLVAPAFHTKRIEAYAQTMVDSTKAMLDRWHGQSTLDIDDEMMRVTLQIVVKTLFNVDISAEAERIGDAMTALQQMVGNNSIVEKLLPLWIPTPQRRRSKKAVDDLDEIIYGLIADWKKEGKDNGDLLSMLMLTRDDEGNGMSDKQVRDEAVTLFLAGHDTTANTLNWTWYLLAQNPEVEAKLHHEIDTVLGGNLPTLADLRRLPYSEMVIKESMRLFPPAYFFGRVAIDDVQLGNFYAPKGTGIGISSYTVHRDPRWWDAPETFRPERFSPENAEHIRKYSYIPFGAGPRVCIGNSFAMMEAHLMLVMIAQRYQLRLSAGQEVKIDPLLTMKPKGGLHLLLEERQVSRPLSVSSHQLEAV